MKELREMVSIINRQGIRKVDVLTPSNEKGLMFELFDGVRKGKFDTDDLAVTKLYGDPTKKEAYKKLKNRLKNQLANTMIFGDNNPVLPDSAKAFIACYRQFAIFWVLLGNGGYQSGFSMGKRILKVAIKYELTELCVMVSAGLRKLSEREGDIKKFDYYNNLAHKYHKLYEAELIACEYEESITIHFIKSRSAKTKLAKQAKQYSEKLKKYTSSMDSSRLFLKAFNVFVLSHEIAGEFDEMRKTCDEAVAYFENKKPRKTNSIFIFLFKSLMYYQRIKDFENGEKVIVKAVSYIANKDSRNYFITIERYILLSITCQKYQVAHEQYYAAVNKKGFELMLDSNKEHWKIYEAYLQFLKLTGELVIDKETKKNKFRLGKFLNEVPTFSKDKMGFNATILIIQILLLLQMKKFETLIDRAESLRIYAYRYLRKPETMRSFYFVKILFEIIKVQFHKEAAIRKCEKYHKKMALISPTNRADEGVIEIIPYEELWKIVLGLLDTKFQKTKKRLSTKK